VRSRRSSRLYLIFTLGAVSLLLTYFLTPLVRDHIGQLGFLDLPDGIRKKHPRPVPRVGGIAIALSYAATFAIAFVLPFSYTYILHNALPGIWKLTLVASIVFLTGVLDDLVGLNAPQKLTGIVVAGVLAYWAGIRVDIHLLPGVSAYPWLGFAITVIWLVGCTNAFNLIDGVDGLAAGVGLFATVTMLVAALTQPNLPLALATMPLVGCLLGFLRYNFNPASVFLGDSGSLLIGFLLGCYGALWSQKSITLVALAAPVLAISIPLLDVVLSILRRFLRSRPIFKGDRGHIHHRLLDRGFSPRGAVLIMYGLCAIAAALSLLASALHNQFSGLIVIVFCVAAWAGIQYLGYAEFAMAGQMFLKGQFRRVIDAETRLLDFETALSKAANLGECWTKIQAGSQEFGFHAVRMSVGGILFQESSRRSSGPEWQLRIPLSGTEYVNFFRDLDSGSDVDPLILSAFVRCVERGLKQSVGNYEPEAIPLQPGSALVYATGASGGARVARSSAG
jgi:UDP-GlcNAc:undecaprenyl-phosphate GlcNAc-1-phosphate transferase